MVTFYVKCGIKTENLNPKIFKTKNNRLLLSNLGIKTLLSKIPLLNALF